jgi:DNA sulfur modification protein DndD
MHLRSISLRDWKAFETARFDFPAPTTDRNVILLGGQNGFGKTSLFEAITLGLFGRDGLRLVQRAAAAADEDRRAQSYREFLQRALNGRALRNGRNTCRITLVFEDEAGEPIEIERAWHFTDLGVLRPGAGGEVIQIVKGRGRRPVAPPLTEPDTDSWYRDWLARHFLHPDLAGFFLFDGEAASVYAERDMGVQVRQGIEGLLGLTWLRRLAESLRPYAANRRTQVARGATSEAIEALERQIKRLDAELKGAQTRLEEIEAALPSAESEREAIMRELMAYGTGSRADNEDWIRRQAEHEQQYRAAQDQLFALSERDLPFALAGTALRQRVVATLERERRLEQWTSGAAATRERANDALGTIAAELSGLAPPLTPEQHSAIEDAIRRALERMWHPPPTDAADSIRHGYLLGRLRDDVRSVLAGAETVTAGTVTRLQDSLASATSALREIKDRIDASRVSAPQIEEKRKRLDEIANAITKLKVEQNEQKNLLTSRSGEVQQRRAELGRLTAQLNQSERPARLAKRAEEVAEMLEELVGEALPLQSDAIAAAMTSAIHAMAHKRDLFRRVEIDSDGEVRLSGPDGRNLRDLDLSAGEKQVFTQALFAAVAEVCGRIFPLVVDTPLGRLDEDHRLNVLRHLAERSGQVILISTNTEVVGPYLDAVRPRLAKSYRLENRTEGDVGITWPVEGYFPGQGI